MITTKPLLKYAKLMSGIWMECLAMLTNALNFSSESRILIVSPEISMAILGAYLSKGHKLFSLDGTELKSKQELLSKLSQAMKFPDYFGGNWDALEECLNDLEWLPASGYVIQFKNADTFIKCCHSDFETFTQIIDSVSRFWEKNNVEFTLIIETYHQDEPN